MKGRKRFRRNIFGYLLGHHPVTRLVLVFYCQVLIIYLRYDTDRSSSLTGGGIDDDHDVFSAGS